MVCLNPKKPKKIFYHTKENKNYFLTVNNNQAEARKIFMEFGILFLSSENELFSHSFVLYFFLSKTLLTYLHSFEVQKRRQVGFSQHHNQLRDMSILLWKNDRNTYNNDINTANNNKIRDRITRYLRQCHSQSAKYLSKSLQTPSSV